MTDEEIDIPSSVGNFFSTTFSTTTIPLNESDYKFVKDFISSYFSEEDNNNIMLTNLIIQIFGLTFEQNIDKAEENFEKAKNIADLLFECKNREDNDLMIFDFLRHRLINRPDISFQLEFNLGINNGINGTLAVINVINGAKPICSTDRIPIYHNRDLDVF